MDRYRWARGQCLSHWLRTLFSICVSIALATSRLYLSTGNWGAQRHLGNGRRRVDVAARIGLINDELAPRRVEVFGAHLQRPTFIRPTYLFVYLSVSSLFSPFSFYSSHHPTFAAIIIIIILIIAHMQRCFAMSADCFTTVRSITGVHLEALRLLIIISETGHASQRKHALIHVDVIFVHAIAGKKRSSICLNSSGRRT